MTCKLDHTIDGTIPGFLCRACNPKITAPATEASEDHTRVVNERALDRLNARAKRNLRAEVKTWRNRVELMKKHNTHPKDIAKAEETLRKAEHDLYLVA